MIITKIPLQFNPTYKISLQVRQLKRAVEMGSLLLAGLLMLRAVLLLRQQHLLLRLPWLILRTSLPQCWEIFKYEVRIQHYRLTHLSVPTTGPADGQSPSLSAKVKGILMSTIQVGRTLDSFKFGKDILKTSTTQPPTSQQLIVSTSREE